LWADKSGNGRHAIQSNVTYRPTVINNGLDAKSVIRFDTSGLTIGAPLFSNNFDIYLVLKAAADFNENMLLLGQWAAGVANRWAMSGPIGGGFNTLRFYLGGTPASYPVSTLSIGQTWSILSISKTSLTGNFHIDGVPESFALNTSEIAALNFSIGGGDNGTAAHWPGDIAELVALPAAADNTHRQNIEGYLAHKWDLTANLSVDHPYKNEAPTKKIVNMFLNSSTGDVYKRDDILGWDKIGTIKPPVRPWYSTEDSIENPGDYLLIDYNAGVIYDSGLPGWLMPWTKRRKITINHANIDVDLVHFPLPIIISSSCGEGNQDVTDLFDEIEANFRKIAVTLANGTTQISVEVERWDTVNRVGILWVSAENFIIKSNQTTDIYIYYGGQTADNDTYVGLAGETGPQNVWDDNFLHVFNMSETITNDAGCIKTARVYTMQHPTLIYLTTVIRL
jgi:hypothetical protein